MTTDEVNRLAERMELANHRRDYSLYNRLRETVFMHDRLAVELKVREIARQRREAKL